RVLRDPVSSAWLWVEYHQPLGTYDSYITQQSSSNLYQGALVRYENQLQSGYVYLLDFSPSATPNNFLDSDLTPGHSWSDPYSLLTLSVTHADASGLAVTVGYDAPCATLALSQDAYSSTAQSGSVTVTAPADCAWQASTAAGWISFTGATSGMGNGVVTFNLAANSDATQRNSYITVQRQSLPLAQAGSNGLLVHPLLPAFGSGSVATFTTLIDDGAGTSSDQESFWLDDGSGSPLCKFDLAGSKLRLDGSLLIDPGSANSISNGNCTVYGGESALADSGTQRRATWRVAFGATLSGAVRVQMDAWHAGTFAFNQSVGTWAITPSPAIAAVQFPAAGQGDQVPVTIFGNFTHFSAASTLKFSGSGIAVSNVTAPSPTELDATLTIAAHAAVGARTLTVTTGAESVSEPYTVHAPEPPAAPGNVHATPGDSKMVLGWAPVYGATGYNIYLGTAAGGESDTPVLANVSGTTATVTGLVNGTPYYFIVRAYNASYTGAASVEISATPGALAAPHLSYSRAGDGAIYLSWNGVTGAASYNVYQGTSAGGEASTPVRSGVTSTQATVPNLVNGTHYFFTVRMVNVDGTGPASNELQATPVALTAPSGLTAQAGDGSATLRWTASTGADGYTIYQATTPGGEGSSWITYTSATSITINGLNNGTTYYFTVRGFNFQKIGPPSNEASTIPGPPVPAAPTGVSAVGGNHAVTVAWSASAGAVSYQVYRGSAAG
ncbi:MAG TPA: fibronectin type III domain-containing protein, partial [Nevskiaceae bacterium]|nr:fibronectin type III domain-containing protein [Nevskiaceae bacterium]